MIIYKGAQGPSSTECGLQVSVAVNRVPPIPHIHPPLQMALSGWNKENN